MTSKETPKNPIENKPQKTKHKMKVSQENKDGTPKRPSFWNQVITAVLVFLLAVYLYSLFNGKDEVDEIAISELASNIKAGEVESLTVRGEIVDILYTSKAERQTRKEPGTSISETLTNYGVNLGEIEGLEIDIQNETGFGYWFIQLAPFIIPFLIFAFLIWMLTRQVKGTGMQAFSFGQSRARITDPSDQSKKITFEDVAGVKEAKEELKEIVDFLKNPQKYLDIGAEIPKGVLLMGAPGTGKTLLARAVAGEANVPFFSISGSEFVEMFVGVGASRVRDTFKVAKKASPAIIFIDEIDAVGRTRGAGYGGGNDEREQTLNQILVEMDGFEPNEKVIIMAATNRPDVLDPALLRPGRFDRRVRIDLPDLDDREAILNVHIRKKPLVEDVDLHVIAERTPGFSGADLYSLVNEAAILAAREDRKKVEQKDFVNAIEKVLLGPERRSHLLSEEEKRITAYHEAGHALVASVLEHAHPVHKISIISRGRAAGYTLHLPVEEKRFIPRKEFLDDLAVTLGGYVTEEIVFGDITTGPSNDLQVITARARDMVTKYGMSKSIGPLALESDEGKALYGRASGEWDHSEEVAGQIDREVSRIIHEAHARAKDVVEKNRNLLDEIAEALLLKEVIERSDFEDILKKYGIKLKKKPEPSIVVTS